MSTKLIRLKGFNGKNVYYDPKRKYLYSRNNGYKGTSYLKCFEDVKGAKKRKKKNWKPCGGRRRLNANGKSWSTHGHAKHKNHETVYRDIISLNAMKESCRFLGENYSGQTHKISPKIIYLTEIAKYVELKSFSAEVQFCGLPV